MEAKKKIIILLIESRFFLAISSIFLNLEITKCVSSLQSLRAKKLRVKLLLKEVKFLPITGDRKLCLIRARIATCLELSKGTAY